MGLNLATNQCLTAPVNITAPQPYTFMCWVHKAPVYFDSMSLICIGDASETLSFDALQANDTFTRAISFAAFASAQDETHLIDDDNVHFLCAVFNGSTITFYFDDNTPTSQAWSPSGSVAFDLLAIGRTVNTGGAEFFTGTLEHVAVWNTALNSTQVGNLRTQTAVPSDFSNLIAYLPLKDSLTDEVGTLSWTPTNLGSPSYTDLGIEYGATEYTVTYDGNGSGGGTAPTDANSPYANNATVTVLGNTGNLTRTNYTFAGWNTAADGSGTHYDASDTFSITANITLYAEWSANYQYRTINHLNYDPADYTNAEIEYAATKKVYFEHASTGKDIVGDSDFNSSTGNNYDDSADCGLALLYDEDNRYLCSRDNHDSGNDYTWFSTHGGLQDNNRGNPTPANKIGGFVGLSANMRGAIEIAMWKYCWIDVWSETSGYISDGAAAAASDIEDIEAFEAANPGITVVWWTMPLQDDASYAAREAYNSAIRTYCLDHGKWLIDIADIECHNSSGVKQIDGNGREIATTAYMRDDGGHLGTDGRLRMAKAYWSAITAIANDEGSATYSVSGVTYDKNGSILGGCTVSLFKHTGSGVFSYIGTATSDETTGAYDLTAPDGDSAYMVVAFKASTPHVFDVSDYNLTPELIES